MAKLGLALILAFVLMACAGPVHADDSWPDGWRVVHLGTPSGDLRFVDPLNGWGSYGYRRVQRTTDGGQTWTELPALRGYDQYVFVTPLIGWAGRSEICPARWYIDMTTDGGVSWTQQVRDDGDYYCGPGRVDFLHFVDTEYGWADAHAQDRALIKTTDGGRTWSPWTNKPPTGYPHYLNIVSRSVWYWVAPDGFDNDHECSLWRIHKTTDGGATTVEGGLLPWWIQFNAGYSSSSFPDVASDTNTIVLAAKGGRFARSTDFGLTWTEISSPLTGDAGMPRFAGGSHWWAFAGKTLVRSADGGLSWQVQPTSNTADIKSVTAVDADHAFFVAERIYRTADGGATWEALPYAFDSSVSDLAATPSGKLYGAGSTFRTSDGGLTWHEFGFGSSRLDAVGEDHLWALDSQQLYQSTDAGKTWITSTLETGFRTTDFVDAERGWAISLGNAIHRSKDGGASWREDPAGPCVPDGKMRCQDLFFIDAEHGWILARDRDYQGYEENLVVLSTTDGGGTWVTQEPIRLGYSLGVEARLKFFSANDGWLVGYTQHDPYALALLLRTRDGGQTWTNVLLHQLYYLGPLNDVDLAGLNGWAVGADGLVLRTTDGGATWSRFRYPTGAALLSVQTMGPNTVFVGGEGGLVLRWDTPGRLYLPLLVQ